MGSQAPLDAAISRVETRALAVVNALVASDLQSARRAALNFAIALWRGDHVTCTKVLEELDAALLTDHYHGE